MTTAWAEAMSPYELRAWQQIVAQAQRDERRRRSGGKARAAVQRAGTTVTHTWDSLPGTDQIEAALATALSGIQKVTLDAAMQTVNEARVIRDFQQEHPGITELADLRLLDLQECDRRIPRRRTGYGVASVAAGAATSLAITGAVVATTVSGGTTAAVALGALATDVAGTLAGLGRIIAVTAAQYGYDVREPEEELYATGVLSFAMASSSAGKVGALTSLSRLTQAMMRRATWEQLRRHQLVPIIEKVYATLGLKLTQKKLGQVIPVAGALINGGLNAELVDRTFRRSAQAYRLRFLADKYGIDVAAELAGLEDDDAGEPDGPMIDELFDELVINDGPDPVDDPFAQEE